jgi:hypothetical protein
MIIRYQAWRRFARIGGILAIPVTLFLFFQPDVGAWTHTLEILAYLFIILLAVSGALLAIFTRAGVIQLTYSDADRQSLSYKMSRSVAEREQIRKRGFSDRYYEGLEVKPPKRKESDDKPAA